MSLITANAIDRLQKGAADLCPRERSSEVEGAGPSTTTRKNGNVLANVSSPLVFPWGRLFKVCHESLQIHNLHVLIFPGSICAHGKRNIKEGGMLW